MFSVGIIYSSKDFLKFIIEKSIKSDEFEAAFQKYKYASPSTILELCFKCGWLSFKTDGLVIPTERGKSIAEQSYTDALLAQLEDMIKTYNPSWASLIPKGREETRHFLPDNVKQCFKEAGLFGEISQNLIVFWDKLSLAYRNINNEKLLEIGRKGETLSLEFEKIRTGKQPIWQSIESNLSGYDIISSTDSEDSRQLLIEVKSTESNINYANFYISRNEWFTALSSNNYIFHFWHLGKSKNTLYVGDIKCMENHIAIDQKDGEWQSVKIPFKSVLEHCEEYSI